MTASQTIETFQLGNIQSAKENGGKTSNAEKSNGFNDIFDKVNKTYSSESKPNSEESSVAKSQTIDNRNNNSETSSKTETVQDKEAKDITTPKNEENAQADTNEIIDKKDASSTEVKSDKIETTTATETTETSETLKMPIESQTAVSTSADKIQIQNQQLAQTEPKNIEENDKTIETPLEKIAKDLNSKIISAIQGENTEPDQTATVAQTTELETNIKEDSTPETPITISAETLDLMAIAAIDNLTNQKPINVVSNANIQQNASVVGIENSNLAEKMAPNNTLQPQIQTKQDTAATMIKEGPQTIAQSATPGSLQTEQQASPLAQVATEVANTNSNGKDLNVKDINTQNEKNSLTQEVLDSLDAKITSVKTSTASNSDSNTNQNQNQNQQPLLAQQNTQEQTIKIELANNSAQTVVNTVSASDLSASASVDLTNPTQFNTSQLQAQSASTPKEITHSDIMEQINKQLDLKNSLSQNNETTKVTIILRPENLGKIELELVNSKEGLIAKMTAENAQVKEALDKNIDRLRESLGAQGVNVNNVSVKVNETQKQEAEFAFDKQTGQEQQQNQQNQQSNAKHSSNDSTHFGKNLDVNEDEVQIEAEMEQENIKTAKYDGNVDYKI